MAIPNLGRVPDGASEVDFVTREEVGVLKDFLSDGFSKRLGRGIESIKSDQAIQLRLKEHTLMGVAVGIGVGVTIGASVANVPGALIGAAAGGVIGGTAGASYSVITLRLSGEYLDWKGRIMHEKVLPIWKNFTDQIGPEFRCSITGDIIFVPIEAADGRIYEKARIEQWIDTVMGEINQLPVNQRRAALIRTSPERIRPITKEGLLYAERYHRELFARIHTIYNAAITQLLGAGAGLHRDMLDATLEAYREQVLPQKQQIAGHQLLQVQNAEEEGTITGADAQKLRKEINRQTRLPLPVRI